MKIQVGQEFDKLPKIRDIQPGQLRIWAIILLVILSICLAGIPFILYMTWNNLSNWINNLVFIKHQTNSKETTHYLIIDSYSYKDTKRTMNYCTYIIKPYYQQAKNIAEKSSSIIQDNQIVRCIKHKSQKYQIKGQVVNQLKYKLHKTLQQYTSHGLVKKQIQQHQLIFGKGSSFNVPFYNIFLNTFKRRYIRYVVVGLAIVKFVLDFFVFRQYDKKQQALINFLVPIFVIVIISGNLLLSILGSFTNKASINYLQQTQFSVIRQSQIQNIKFKQVVVGDIIKLKQKDIIWFKGIYITEHASRASMIINTLLNDNSDSPMIKVPLMHSLHEITELNIVQPGSRIMGLTRETGSLNQSNIEDISNINHYLIVKQINSIQKFYQEYSSFKTYNNYGSYRQAYDSQVLIFATINFVFVLIIYFIFFTLKKTELKLQIILDFILTLAIFSFPFEIQFFNFWTTLISIIRLKINGAKVVRPIIEQIGLIQTITTQLNIFKKKQFSGYLNQKRSFGLQILSKLKNLQQWIQMYTKTRSKSVFAFFMYCGAMNTDKLNSDLISKQLFDFFQFKFTNQEDFGNTKIKNYQFWRVRKINWKIIKKFQLSNKLQHSVLIKDEFDDKYILIMEGYYVHDGCDQYFKSVILQKRVQYLTTMKQYLQKGKIVRYLCFKQNIAENQLQDIQNKDFQRIRLQKNLTYAGLVIYDQWPSKQSLKVMQTISNSSFQKRSNLQSFFISNSQESQMFGFDHQFQDRKFLYDQSSIERTKFIRQKKVNNTVMHCGKGMLDQSALLAADISIEFESQSPSQSDILIKNIFNIEDVLQEGRWTFQTTKISIIFLALINTCHLFGNGVQYFLQGQVDFQRNIFLYVFGMIIPCLLLNLHSPLKLNILFSNNFFNLTLILNSFISIMALFTFYLLMWTDLDYFCSNSKSQSIIYKHFRLSHYKSEKQISLGESKLQCSSISAFITLSVSLLLIITLDRQNYARQANLVLRHMNKVYMLVVWILFVVMFNISVGISIKSGITILILSLLVYLFVQLKDQNIKKTQRVNIENLVEQNENNFEQTRL